MGYLLSTIRHGHIGRASTPERLAELAVPMVKERAGVYVHDTKGRQGRLAHDISYGMVTYKVVWANPPEDGSGGDPVWMTKFAIHLEALLEQDGWRM